jgi:hypothetical protein
MGSGIAVSILLIPAISASFALAFLPHSMLGLIACLPLIACLALLLQFLKYSWVALQNCREGEDLTFADYLLELSVTLLMLKAWASCAEVFDNYYGEDNIWTNCSFWYVIFSILASLGCGVYLSIMILPALVPMIVAITGVPNVVAGFFAALVVISLIWTTQELLMLIPRFVDWGLQFKLWQRDEKYKDPSFHLVQALLTGTGMALTAYISYLLFPLIVTSLLPFLPQASAVFTALIISLGLVVLTLHTLPPAIHFLARGLRILADKGENGHSGLTWAFKRREEAVRRFILGPEVKIDLREELESDYPKPVILPLALGNYNARAPYSRFGEEGDDEKARQNYNKTPSS